MTLAVELRSITKRFGSFVANEAVSLAVRRGSIHAIIGENGAGKTTLMNVLFGLLQPDEGEILIDGQPTQFANPAAAIAAGIGMVHQHFKLVPSLTVAENVFLGMEIVKGGLIDHAAQIERTAELSRRFGLKVDPTERVGLLSVGIEQRIEILKVLARGARTIILDEPTAVLTPQESRDLFETLRGFVAQGMTVLFISHHLQEVYEICQTVTVLRDARHIVTAPVADLPKSRLIEAMTGENVHLDIADAAGRVPDPTAPVALAVERISGEDFSDVSLTVRSGEVVGLSGSTSSGRVGVAEAIAGLGAYRSGAIRIGSRTLPSGDVPTALALGVGCVPKSRHKEGLVLSMPIADNTTMTINRLLGPLGFIPPAKRRNRAEETIRSLGVVTQGPEQLVSGLSGGNQQKVVMGRALANDPAVLVLMDPTAGVDVKSKEALLGVVERMRAAGKAILVVSSEVEDLRTCDRVLVMRHGSIVAEHKAGWSDNALVASIEGIEAL